jgi:hypothetical protein
MPIRVVSIVGITPPAERSTELGRYRVTVDVGGRKQELTYTVELSAGSRSVSWAPSCSILNDPCVDVLAVAALSDLIVAFHRGEQIELPREVPPLSIGPDTVMIRL